MNMMMTVQMPVMLLMEAVGPISLFRTMLAASASSGATSAAAITAATVGSITTVVRMRMLVLLLLKMQKVLLLMVRVRQPTASSHAKLLMVATDGHILLTVNAPGDQNNSSVGTLLQAPVLLGVRVSISVQ